MRKAFIVLSLAVLMILAAAPAALACGHHAHWKGTGMAFCSCLTDKLDLSDDQQKKMDALKQSTEKKAAPVIKRLKAKKKEIHALWKANKPRRKAILAKQTQMYRIKKKLAVIKVDAHLKLLKILTAEQKAALHKEMETCCKSKDHPEGCDCPKGKGHPEGCDCPGCKKKAEAKQPAKKPCDGCPGCPHHKK